MCHQEQVHVHRDNCSTSQLTSDWWELNWRRCYFCVPVNYDKLGPCRVDVVFSLPIPNCEHLVGREFARYQFSSRAFVLIQANRDKGTQGVWRNEMSVLCSHQFDILSHSSLDPPYPGLGGRVDLIVVSIQVLWPGTRGGWLGLLGDRSSLADELKPNRRVLCAQDIRSFTRQCDRTDSCDNVGKLKHSPEGFHLI